MYTPGLGTTTFTYTDAERLKIEYGPWTYDGVTNAYHSTAPGLRTGLAVAQPSSYWNQTFGYDAADRMTSVVSPAGTFTYWYKGPGSVWTNLALPTYYASAITNGYDSGGRITRTALRSGAGATLNSHAYLYDSAGRRQRNTLTDNRYTTYGYDNDGQLSSSLGYTSGGTPIAAEQLGFGYDAGWNMSSRSVNGSGTTYSVDDRNALTAGPDPAYGYDGNGNLTSKGLYSGTIYYYYDDENRLTNVTSGTTYKTDFAYDGLSRLRIRTEYTYSGGWVVSSTTRYIYDGMRVVQERNASNTPLVAYTRGQDLSGAFEGAGGIGGLLERSSGYSGGSWGTHNFYHADGNGNITYLATTLLATAASYKYDPYGNAFSVSDSIGNVYRFSSKEQHLNSGFYYYGYRFYAPSLQRWLSRDPLGEAGHRVLRGACTSCYSVLSRDANPYVFCGNGPTLRYDALGLTDDSDCLAALQKAMVAAAAAGARCGLIGAATGFAGVLAGLGSGAVVGSTSAGPGWGTVAGVCVAGGVEIYDWIHFRHCMKKVQEMKDKAQKDYDACMAKANR